MSNARSIKLIGVSDEPCHGYPTTTLSVEFEVTRDDGTTFPLCIPIVKGAHATIAGRPIWGWDGDRAAPTIEPSIRSDFAGKRFHCFIRRGVIDPCGDSQLIIL